MRKLTLSLPKDLEEELASKLKKENLTDVEYLLKLIKNDLVAKIDLGEGFYYHNQSDRFYNSKNEEIIMTKIEKKLILVGTQRIWPARAFTLGHLTHNDLASVRIAKRATKSL